MLTIEQIQADYPLNLTCCIEKHLPGYTRGDDWFGERMMNGMNRGCFVPDDARPGHYWMRYFGACWYDINDLYALPDVAILFNLKDDGLPNPLEIHLTGRLSHSDHDPFRKHVFMAADGDAWLQAKRVARVAGAVCTEVEEHFAGTHLNAEQYAIAAYRNLRLNPVAGLLLPHLKEVALINHSADEALIAGYIPTATALTRAGIQQRTHDILGLQDWRGWQPMKAVSLAHGCAKAERLFWEVLGEYVDEFFRRQEDGIKSHWGEIQRFADDLVAHSVPVFLTAPQDAPPADPRHQELARQRLLYYCQQYGFDPHLPRERIRGELKTVSRITAAGTYDAAQPQDWQNLKDACRYVIMQATYMHTWINEHQYDDLGEVRYSCGGLRFGDGPSESWRRERQRHRPGSHPQHADAVADEHSLPHRVRLHHAQRGTRRQSAPHPPAGGSARGLRAPRRRHRCHRITNQHLTAHDHRPTLSPARHPPSDRQRLRQGPTLALRKGVRPGAGDFLSLPKRQRMSHNNGIAATGTLRIVDDPQFPTHSSSAPASSIPAASATRRRPSSTTR